MGAVDESGHQHRIRLALIALGLILFVLVIVRQDVAPRLGVAPSRAGWPGFNLIQRYWVIFGLVVAGVAMIVASVWPTWLGALGAPAIVFLGLGLIIPVIVIAIQTDRASAFPSPGRCSGSPSSSGCGWTITVSAGAPSAARRLARSIA